MRLITYDANTNYASTAQQNVINDGRWHQCVLEIGSTPTNVMAFMDGEMDFGTVTLGGVIGYIETNLPVTMGSVGDPVDGRWSRYYDGSLSDVRIYTNHVLNPQEVADLFLWRGQP
jgi:hypothetical protein